MQIRANLSRALVTQVSVFLQTFVDDPLQLNREDGVKIREAGSEQHIRSNFFGGFKAANGFIQVWISVGEIVRSRGQREWEREGTGSLCGRRNAFDRQAEIIKWPIAEPGTVDTIANELVVAPR
jgi:hypothetical protein